MTRTVLSERDDPARQLAVELNKLTVVVEQVKAQRAVVEALMRDVRIAELAIPFLRPH
jgi:hypothetical protein